MAESPDSIPERLRQRKPLIWMGRSLRDIGEFPDRVKGELGYGLDLAQAAKPLKGFKGSGEFETHITVSLDNNIDRIERLHGWCIDRNLEFLHILLDRGVSRSQPIMFYRFDSMVIKKDLSPSDVWVSVGLRRRNNCKCY